MGCLGCSWSVPEIGKMDPVGIMDGGAWQGWVGQGDTGWEFCRNSVGILWECPLEQLWVWKVAPEIPGMAVSPMTHTRLSRSPSALLGTRVSHMEHARLPAAQRDFPGSRHRSQESRPGIPAGLCSQGTRGKHLEVKLDFGKIPCRKVGEALEWDAREGVESPFPAGFKAVGMWHWGDMGSAGNGWTRWDQRDSPTSTIPGIWGKHEEATEGHHG